MVLPRSGLSSLAHFGKMASCSPDTMIHTFTSKVLDRKGSCHFYVPSSHAFTRSHQGCDRTYSTPLLDVYMPSSHTSTSRVRSYRRALRHYVYETSSCLRRTHSHIHIQYQENERVLCHSYVPVCHTHSHLLTYRPTLCRVFPCPRLH